MAQVFPNNLVGGIPNRQAFESELSLSLDFHENNFRDDPIAVFIDRTKCFDLILPELAMGLASSLGYPWPNLSGHPRILSPPGKDLQTWECLW